MFGRRGNAQIVVVQVFTCTAIARGRRLVGVLNSYLDLIGCVSQKLPLSVSSFRSTALVASTSRAVVFWGGIEEAAFDFDKGGSTPPEPPIDQCGPGCSQRFQRSL